MVKINKLKKIKSRLKFQKSLRRDYLNLIFKKNKFFNYKVLKVYSSFFKRDFLQSSEISVNREKFFFELRKILSFKNRYHLKDKNDFFFFNIFFKKNNVFDLLKKKKFLKVKSQKKILKKFFLYFLNYKNFFKYFFSKFLLNKFKKSLNKKSLKKFLLLFFKNKKKNSFNLKNKALGLDFFGTEFFSFKIKDYKNYEKEVFMKKYFFEFYFKFLFKNLVLNSKNIFVFYFIKFLNLQKDLNFPKIKSTIYKKNNLIFLKTSVLNDCNFFLVFLKNFFICKKFKNFLLKDKDLFVVFNKKDLFFFKSFFKFLKLISFKNLKFLEKNKKKSKIFFKQKNDVFYKNLNIQALNYYTLKDNLFDFYKLFCLDYKLVSSKMEKESSFLKETNFFDKNFYKLSDESERGKSNFDYKLKQLKIFKFFYGNISKRQLKFLCKRALKNRQNAISTFIKNLESRLDIAVYRLGFHESLSSVKQDILHKKILINNKIVTFYNFEINENDIISFSKNLEISLKKKFFKNLIKRRKRSFFFKLKRDLCPEIKLSFISFLKRKARFKSFYSNIKKYNIIKPKKFSLLMKNKKFLRRKYYFSSINQNNILVNKNLNLKVQNSKYILLKNTIPNYFEYNLRTFNFIFLKSSITEKSFICFNKVNFGFILGVTNYF